MTLLPTIPPCSGVPFELREGQRLRVEALLSRAGDSTTFAAEMDLVAGLTACSSPHSNNLRNKPIHYEILDVD